MPDWTIPQIIIGLVALQRLAELALARRNTERLLAAGAEEHAPGHYPVMVLIHAGWLVALILLARESVSWPLIAVFCVLQAGRVWVIATLGRFWTTRIISLPNAPVVRKGPFRLVRHPNYLVVAGEIIVLPLAFNLPWVAVVFGLANFAILAWRIRAEDAVLANRREKTDESAGALD